MSVVPVRFAINVCSTNRHYNATLILTGRIRPYLNNGGTMYRANCRGVTSGYVVLKEFHGNNAAIVFAEALQWSKCVNDCRIKMYHGNNLVGIANIA